LASCGVLKPGELVWAEGAAKWVEASMVPGLFPAPGQSKYWLAIDGKTRGPYVLDQIRAALATRQLTLDTLACADGAREWQPLGQHDEFRNFVPGAVTPSAAKLFASTLDIEEATLHLAGKSGDALAKLIGTLMELKRNYANNPGLVANLNTTIEVLQNKRDKEMPPAAE
jgi:hypothetical protein